MRFVPHKFGRFGATALASGALVAGGSALATATAAASVPLPIIQTSFLTFHNVGDAQRVVNTDLKRLVCDTDVTGQLSTTSLLGLIPIKVPLANQTVTITDGYGSHAVTTDQHGDFSYTAITDLHLFPNSACSAAETAADGVTASYGGALSPILVGAVSAPMAVTTASPTP